MDNTNDSHISPEGTGPDRIDLHSDEAVKVWKERLNVTDLQLREAVQAVGDRATDVEMHLKGSRSTTNDDRVEEAGAGAGR
ncbi:MAG: DUF3606 domain-containing protein [Polaromonas sp.]|nr:DUF3606 domain-containing protein [Polaromonas sp.]